MHPIHRCALIVVSAITAITLAPSHAEAKQCIWNKAGFVLNVKWYRKNQVFYEADKYNPQKFDAANYKFVGDPVREDTFPVAQGRCNETDEELTAVLTAVGADFVNDAISIAAGTAAAIGSGVIGAVACVGSAGAACPAAAAGIAAATGGAISGAARALPKPQEIILVGVPSTKNYIDVWGTIWKPQTGPGGKI